MLKSSGSYLCFSWEPPQFGRPESVVGQSRHFDSAPRTSALLRSADIADRVRQVRRVPRPEVTRRLNAFLQRAIEREAGANIKSCTDLWGSNRALV